MKAEYLGGREAALHYDWDIEWSILIDISLAAWASMRRNLKNESSLYGQLSKLG